MYEVAAGREVGLIEWSAADPKVAFVDIDGVLADTRHREKYVTEGRQEWGPFFAQMEWDGVHESGLAAVDGLVKAGWDIVYLTGRNGHYRERTARWLENNGFSLEWDMVMRPEGLKTGLGEWKAEVVRSAVDGPVGGGFVQRWWQGFYQNALVMDDDSDVCKQVESVGFPAVLTRWQVKPSELVARKKA